MCGSVTVPQTRNTPRRNDATQQSFLRFSSRMRRLTSRPVWPNEAIIRMRASASGIEIENAPALRRRCCVRTSAYTCAETAAASASRCATAAFSQIMRASRREKHFEKSRRP